MMNRIEHLMETPFSQLTAERKMEIKRFSSYQPKPCSLVQVCGMYVRMYVCMYVFYGAYNYSGLVRHVSGFFSVNVSA